MTLIILAVSVAYTYGQNIGSDKRFGIKAKADIGLGSAFNIDYSLPMESDKSSQNRFGLEFMYTFCRIGKNSLDAGTGIEVEMSSFSADFADFKYNYAADPEADQDGDYYIRHSAVSDAELNLKTLGLGIPIFIRYSYNIHDKWDLFAKSGLLLDLNLKSKSEYKNGTISSFGIYPQYDNLMIDDEWLNDFGTRDLSSIKISDNPGFRTTLAWMIEAGVRFHIIRDLSLSVGVNYNAGLTSGLRPDRIPIRDGDITEREAIITYNEDNGLIGKSLNNTMAKCKLNRIGMEIGLEFHF